MKEKILYIVSFILSTWMFGQVKLSVLSDARDSRNNGTVKLTIILEISGPNMVQETPLRLPDLSNFVIVADGSEQNTFIDTKRNIAVNQQIFQYLLTPKQTGKQRIGSVLVTVNGRIYKSEPFDIIVDEPAVAAVPEKNKNNIYLNIELKNPEVYKNQPTVAVLRAYSKDLNNFRQVYNVKMPKQSHLIIKPVSFKKSEINQDLKKGVASQVLGVFMIYPKKSGKIEIPAASASFKRSSENGKKIYSNTINLRVKKLPKATTNGFKNAVGNFDYDIFTDKNLDELEIDKPFNLSLKLSGSGNLNDLVLPNLQRSSEYIFYAPKINYNVLRTTKSETGEVVMNYIVIPKVAGNINITAEPFAFFNPEIGKYVNLGAKEKVVKVLSHDDFNDSKSPMERVNEYTNNVLETVNTPVIPTKEYKVESQQPFSWRTVFLNYGIIGGILFLLIFLFTWDKNDNSKKNKLEAFVVKNIADTEQDIKEKWGIDVESNLVYMENQLNKEDFHGFFNTFEEMKSDVEQQISNQYHISVTQFLESQNGSVIAEDYCELLQQVQMEKYIPHPSKENVQDIYYKSKKIFANFVK